MNECIETHRPSSIIDRYERDPVQQCTSGPELDALALILILMISNDLSVGLSDNTRVRGQ